MCEIEELLLLTNDSLINSIKQFDKTEKDVERDIVILKEWLRQQPHLPDDEDERRLEKILLRNKCRVEQTKTKLEYCYTFKTAYPELMIYYDVNSEKQKQARRNILFVPMPEMTEKMHRIIIIKIADAIKTHPHDFYSLFPIYELLNTYDTAVNIIYCIDWNGISFDVIKTMDFAFMNKLYHVSMNCLSGRFSDVIYLNAPSYIDLVLKLLKLMIKPKLFERIKICSSLESAYKVIPQHLLPVEYGGKQRSLHELHDEWGKILSQHENFLKNIAERKSNESLRINSVGQNELFGTDGTFKKINLD